MESVATFGQIANDNTSSRLIPRCNPLVLWHLLSLDAPTVAMLWTWFLARANGIHLPPASVMAMAVAVWLLYASDRLLDTRQSPARVFHDLEERHYFHRANLRAFTVAIALALLVLAALLPALSAPSIRLYLVLGTLLLGYFGLIHASPLNTDERRIQRLPKELAVGVFFSAATFIPTVSREPGLRLALLPAALLFAVLCSVNCLFIYTWEHPAPTPSRSTIHPATRLALRFLPEITLAAAISGAALSSLAMLHLNRLLSWPIPAACALSALFLWVLHLLRTHLTGITLRAAADLCLLAPILLIPFLPH